jgi:hypothetical protein
VVLICVSGPEEKRGQEEVQSGGGVAGEDVSQLMFKLDATRDTWSVEIVEWEVIYRPSAHFSPTRLFCRRSCNLSRRVRHFGHLILKGTVHLSCVIGNKLNRTTIHASIYTQS